MPYLDLRISGVESRELADRAVSCLMRHTSQQLGKRPEVTSISVSFVKPELWFVGGSSIAEQGGGTFYLDIKVTEGTNTKAEKARYVDKIFSEMQELLGGLNPASYIVIHELRADAWGFQGKTQEYRFIRAHSL